MRVLELKLEAGN